MTSRRRKQTLAKAASAALFEGLEPRQYFAHWLVWVPDRTLYYDTDGDGPNFKAEITSVENIVEAADWQAAVLASIDAWAGDSPVPDYTFPDDYPTWFKVDFAVNIPGESGYIQNDRLPEDAQILAVKDPGDGNYENYWQLRVWELKPELFVAPPPFCPIPPPGPSGPNGPSGPSGPPGAGPGPGPNKGKGNSGRGWDSGFAFNYSNNPVNYADGALYFSSNDLGSNGFDGLLGYTRRYTNAGDNLGNLLFNGGLDTEDITASGLGWVLSQVPTLTAFGDYVVITAGAGEAMWFESAGGGSYDPLFFAKDDLQLSLGVYTWTNPAGEVVTFDSAGLFTGMTDAYGNVTTATYDGYGVPSVISRTTGSGASEVLEEFVYTFVDNFGQGNDFKVASLTLQRSVANEKPVTVRKAQYSYGELEELTKVVIKDGDDQTLNTEYYRYYGDGDGASPENGFPHALKSVVTGAAYDRLLAAYPNPDIASDAQVAEFADFYFEYDALGRVAKEVVQGAGCSMCSGGAGTYTFAYEAGSGTDFETWAMKTTETRPDGSTNTVFSNTYGQVLLEVLTDGSDQWADFYKYDDTGRMVMHANPSAINGDLEDWEAEEDLMLWDGDDYAYLNPSTGLIEEYEFGDTLTATDSSDGDVPGYLKYSKMKLGESGVVTTTLKKLTYIKSPNADVYLVASDTIYHNSNLTGGQETEYSYTWFGATAQVASMTVNSPQILDDHNGPDTTIQTITAYDTFGRVAWTKDGDGFVTFYEYDNATGAVITTIRDADTSDFRTTDVTLSASSISSSGTTATATTTSNHGLAAGDWVRIRGSSDTEYNGLFRVATISSSTVFTYTMESDPSDDSADGTIEVSPLSTALISRSVSLTASSTTATATSSSAHGYKVGDWIRVSGVSPSQYNGLFQVATVPSATTFTYTTLSAPGGSGSGTLTWGTPSAGGVSATTQQEVDGLGRTTKLTDPNGNITYIVYNDPDHETRIYRGWTSGNKTTSPIEIIRDRVIASDDTLFSEILTISASPSLDGNRPDGEETINSWNIMSLSRSITNTAGQVIEVDEYFSLNGLVYSTTNARLSGSGSNDSSVGNYHATQYDYDNYGQVKRIISPSGTITRIERNAREQVVSEWIGTDDTPTSGWWTPSNTAGTNLVKVTEYEYDGGSDGGDGNLTEVTRDPGGGATTRVTLNYYDWRNRLVAIKYADQGGGESGSDQTHPITYLELDNLDRILSISKFDGDTVSISSSSGVPTAPSSSLLRAKTTYAYDDLDRLFVSKTFSVNPSNGTPSSDFLSTNYWYDRRGDVIKTSEPGGLVTKTVYDGLGRVSRVYQSDGGGDAAPAASNNWRDAGGIVDYVVSGDTVLSQLEYEYDANGNPILATTRERNHNETLAGGLGDFDTGPTARVSYVRNYYDKVNRLVDSANVGTYNAGSYTPSTDATVPSRSDTKLVTTHEYASDEIQVVRITGSPSSGNFKLRIVNLALGNETTTTLAHNASAGDVESALNALSAIDDVDVTGTVSTGFVIKFVGNQTMYNMPQLSVVDNTLNNSATVTVQTYINGNSGYHSRTTDARGLVTLFSSDLIGRRSQTVEAYDHTAPLQDADNSRITQQTYNGNGDVLTMKAILPGNAFQTTKYVYGLDQSITKLERSSSTATATLPEHGFQVSDKVVIRGADQTDYNGLFTITAVTGDTFSYTVSGSPATPATGHIYVQRAVSSLTRSSSTATATLSNHGFKVGQSIAVSGADQTEYNGNFTITAVPSSDTFSYTISGTPASGTGTIIARPASDTWGNEILLAVRYPDKSTGSASAAEQETFTYNALGERKAFGDRNGNVHEYEYDVLGRLTKDAVTTLGSGVDGWYRRHEYNYNTQGLPYQLTVYSAATSGTVRNQIQREYNGLGQLITEYQEYNYQPVNTTTTPKVQYTFSEMSGAVNHSRLTKITYPNGRIVRYEYGTSGNVVSDAVNDSISRLTYLADDSTGSIGTHLEEYEYLGLSTAVKRVHPQPGVDLTYIDNADMVYGDGGDQYEGLDRFGRIIDQKWTTSGGTVKDRFKYGYDRNSNVLYRDNQLDNAYDELYHADGANGYDNLNRLMEFQRGALSGSPPDTVSSASRTLNFTLDALGNWDSLGGSSSQDRTHNAQNQITGGVGTTPAYDNNGNMTTNQSGHTIAYDAWNRIANVYNGFTQLAIYNYDARGHRTAYADAAGTVRSFYYSEGYQVIQVDDNTHSWIDDQYVWSPVYVDAMVLRDRNTDGNSSLEERLYVMHDANLNTTGVINTSGTVVERYIQDPYGAPTVIDDDWTSDANGLSDVSWVYLHQGGRYNFDTEVYHFRRRDYDPNLGRWYQQDPLEYVDGASLYQYVAGRPGVRVDPQGLGPNDDWIFPPDPGDEPPPWEPWKDEQVPDNWWEDPEWDDYDFDTDFNEEKELLDALERAAAEEASRAGVKAVAGTVAVKSFCLCSGEAAGWTTALLFVPATLVGLAGRYAYETEADVNEIALYCMRDFTRPIPGMGQPYKEPGTGPTTMPTAPTSQPANP